VYSDSGEYVTSVTLLQNSYHLIGIDSKDNVILSEFDTGIVYSINNILQLNPYNMRQYIIFHKKIYDMTIDCDGNLWILHGNQPYQITKYVPLHKKAS
jgi:hypothetical protein